MCVMGQKLEQVFVTGSGYGQSLMAGSVITLAYLYHGNAISGEERLWYLIFLYTTTINSKYRSSRWNDPSSTNYAKYLALIYLQCLHTAILALKNLAIILPILDNPTLDLKALEGGEIQSWCVMSRTPITGVTHSFALCDLLNFAKVWDAGHICLVSGSHSYVTRKRLSLWHNADPGG